MARRKLLRIRYSVQTPEVALRDGTPYPPLPGGMAMDPREATFRKRSDEEYALDMEYALALGDPIERKAFEEACDPSPRKNG